jgi:site-specific recombinase XerD
MAKVPTLRRHVTGVYFCQFAGQRRYFSVDLEESRKAYREALRDWTMWQDDREQNRVHARKRARVIDIVRHYLASRITDTSPEQHLWARYHLGRFTRIWAALPADDFNAQLLQAFKTDLVDMITDRERKLSPRTINHDIRAIKALFRWASDMGYCREVNLRAVKTVAMPQLARKGISVEAVERIINVALGRVSAINPKTGRPLEPNPNAAAWLAINYLAALRPSEVVRLIQGDGEWIGKGLFQPRISKTFKDGRHPRVYLLSDEALMWLRHARPTWNCMKNYGAGVRRAVGPGFPHPLRHSAATHLVASGAPRAEVDVCLGHYPRLVSQIYAPVELAPLRATLARLSLARVAPGC